MNRDRYLRQQGIEGLAVERLQSMHVSVVGAGAVGNEVVKNLVLMGVGAIDVHDFDRVEIHNLTRSVFLRDGDVGERKAQAVVDRASELDPNVRLRAIEGDAWRTLRLADLRRRDAVICAVDNLEARMRLSQLCLLAGVDLVNAGIDSRYASVEVFAFSSTAPQACFECHLPGSAYGKVAERYSCGWLRRALLAEEKVATTAITASVAGALAVQAALRVGGHAGAESRRILLDTRSGRSTVVSLTRNAACAGCAHVSPRPRHVAARPGLAACACNACGRRRCRAALGPGDLRLRVHGLRANAARDEIHRSSRGRVRRPHHALRRRAGNCRRAWTYAPRPTVDELRRLFADSPVPVKFLLAKVGEPDAVCIDLEE